MKIIGKITGYTVEYEDMVYYRWSEDDWSVQLSDGELLPLVEECVWLEELFQSTKRKDRLKNLDDLIPLEG